jgi:hypothetical protein
MEFFRLEAAYDTTGNSSWDALWYDGDDEDLDALSCQMRLGPVWKSPLVRLETRDRRPDVYQLHLYFAFTQRVSEVLSALVQESAEFLPLRLPGSKRVYVMHVLSRVDLDTHALVDRNKVSGNITDVRKYSFVKQQIRDAIHVFQIRQAAGSAGRDAGYAVSTVLVSSKFKDICEQHQVQGITFERIE